MRGKESVCLLAFALSSIPATAGTGAWRTSVSAEYPRLLVAGAEREFINDSVLVGFNVGGATFGTEHGEGFGRSVAFGIRQATDILEHGMYWGWMGGWQEAQDGTSTHGTSGPGGTENWSYQVSTHPIETAYFATPYVGIEFYRGKTVTWSSELGWHQTFAVKRDERRDVQTDGNYTANMSESERDDAVANPKERKKTKGVVHITLAKLSAVL